MSVGLLNLMLLVPQCISTYFMEAGNDKLLTSKLRARYDRLQYQD